VATGNTTQEKRHFSQAQQHHQLELENIIETTTSSIPSPESYTVLNGSLKSTKIQWSVFFADPTPQVVGLCHLPREGCGGLLAECPNDGLHAAKRKRRAGEDSAVCRLQSQVGKMAEKLCGFKNTSHPCVVLHPMVLKLLFFTHLHQNHLKPSESI
jgi:hypothetical protein